MNRPYYDEVGFEPRYSTSRVLEDVLDDRELPDGDLRESLED